MQSQVIVVGMGQLGALLSEGFLKSGRGVVPVLRGGDLAATSRAIDPEALVVATGEDDLEAVLATVSKPYRDRVVLIQNELRPDQWQRHGIQPTVGIIWFEKKKGKLPKTVLPSVLFGPQTPLLERALDHLELPHRSVASQADLAHELVLKNLYILGLNLAGLRRPSVAFDLLESHRDLFDEILDELLTFETALIDEAEGFSAAELDEDRLRRDLEGAILAEPDHGCAGRSAPRRLERTLAHAARIGLKMPVLSQLQQEIS